MSFRLNLPPLFRRMDEIYTYLTREINRLNYALGFLDVPEATGSTEIRSEDPNNKSIKLGVNSTNTQYPSARAVVEYVDENTVPPTRTVNGKALSADITLDAGDVGAVPTEREINGHALSGDLTLIPGDLGEGDFITETGTTGIWTYRKWNSGIAECWGISQVDIPASSMTAFGSFYSYEKQEAWPSGLFIAGPAAEYSCYAASRVFFVGMKSYSISKNYSGYAVFFSANPTTDTYAKVSIYAVGRWKE